eukprot:m51a1_g8018 putative lmbr1-like conserved region-containing protein (476) ;mRNA; f:198074-199920
MNAWLVVVMVVIPILLILADIYFLVYFQHPEDKWSNWVPKVLVVAGLFMSEVVVLFLPLDVANRGPPSGGIPMGTLWLIMYIAVPVWALVVIPGWFWWYDAEEADSYGNAKRLRRTLWHEFFLLFVFSVVYAIGYIFFGVAEVRTQKLDGDLVEAEGYNRQYCAGCRSQQSFMDIRVSPILFLVTAITLLGYLLMCVFGSIGLVTVPWDLALGYKHRPKRITADQWAKGREEIGKRADNLVQIGNAIVERRRMGKVGRREREQVNRWRQACYVLEEDYARLKDAHELKGLQILLGYIQAPLSFFAFVLSVFWVLHILLYIIIPTPPTKFLNGFFQTLNNAWGLLGVIAYAIFSFYLLLCVIKGNIKFGMRFFFFIPVYPMKIGDTLMNSMLFNTALIMVGALTVTQFCTVAFDEFTRQTAVNQLFVMSIGNLRVIKYWFKYAPFSFIGLPILVFIYMLYRPKDVESTSVVNRRGV